MAPSGGVGARSGRPSSPAPPRRTSPSAGPTRSEADIRAAARIAGAEGFLDDLPRGFATPLGEQGLRLSGGQRQRIAIARAALVDRPLVLLDEFTANLDRDTEADVLAAVRALLVGRTAVMVAHRPATIAAADRVVRLERGRVVEVPGRDRRPPPRTDRPTVGTGPIRRVLRGAGRYRGWVLAAALLSFVSLGAGIGLVAMSAYLISRSALVDSTETLALAILGVRAFAVLRVVARYAERYIGHLGTFRILTRLRVWFFRGILPGAPASMIDRRSGDVLSSVVADVDTLQDLYLRVLVPPIAGAMAIGLGCVVLGALRPRAGAGAARLPAGGGGRAPAGDAPARAPPGRGPRRHPGRDGRRDRRGPDRDRRAGGLRTHRPPGRPARRPHRPPGRPPT